MPDDGDRHITSRELDDFKDFIDERFKSHRNQMLLYIGVAVGLLKLQVPDPVTAAAVAAMIAKGLVAFTGWRL